MVNPVRPGHQSLSLRVMAQSIAQWNDEEVLRRVGQLCPTCVEGMDTWTDSTSISQRLREAAASQSQTEGERAQQPTVDASQDPRVNDSQDPMVDASPEPTLEQCPDLAPMEDDRQAAPGRSESLPISLLQYLALLEWTGRVVRDDKRSFITTAPTELLFRFGLDPDRWLESVEQFGSLGGFVGRPSQLKERASELGRHWLKGID